MSIQQAAQAVALFPNTTVMTTRGSLPLRLVMLAIAGSESGWVTDADGDCGLGGPACGTCRSRGGGATSWGLWQIHNTHAAYLSGQTGSTSACAWRTWLFVPEHNAQAAYAIYREQGLAAWSSYGNGKWALHLSAARAALASVRATPGSAAATTTIATPFIRTITTSPYTVLGAAFLMGGLTIAAYEATDQRAKIREWVRRQRKHGTISVKGD